MFSGLNSGDIYIKKFAKIVNDTAAAGLVCTLEHWNCGEKINLFKRCS